MSGRRLLCVLAIALGVSMAVGFAGAVVYVMTMEPVRAVPQPPFADSP